MAGFGLCLRWNILESSSIVTSHTFEYRVLIWSLAHVGVCHSTFFTGKRDDRSPALKESKGVMRWPVALKPRPVHQGRRCLLYQEGSWWEQENCYFWALKGPADEARGWPGGKLHDSRLTRLDQHDSTSDQWSWSQLGATTPVCIPIMLLWGLSNALGKAARLPNIHLHCCGNNNFRHNSVLIEPIVSLVLTEFNQGFSYKSCFTGRPVHAYTSVINHGFT